MASDPYVNTDILVFYYLAKKGYRSAANALMADPVVKAFYDEEKQKPQRENMLSVPDLEERVLRLFHAVPLLESFTALCRWIDDLGLDAYRFELSRVLYPMFLHILLDPRARGVDSADANGAAGKGGAGDKPKEEGAGKARGGSAAPRDGSAPPVKQDDGTEDDRMEVDEEGGRGAADEDEREERLQGRLGQYAAFLKQHRPRFASFLGRPCRARAAEIDTVAKAALSGTLDADPYLSSLRSIRPVLVLNEAALDLLRTHLVEVRAVELLNLLTSRLTVVGDAGVPPLRIEDVDPEGEDRTLGGEQHEGAVAVDAINRLKLTLGVLEGNLEDKLRQRQRQERQQEEAAREAEEKAKKVANAAAAAAAAAGGEGGEAGGGPGAAAEGRPAGAEGGAGATGPSGAEDPSKKADAPAGQAKVQPPATKKGKVDAGKARARGDEDLPERMKAEIPLPEVDADWEAQVLEEMKLRVQPSRDELPSCCFMTFVNTNYGLTCADIAPDASALVAGFDDSAVRFVDLSRGKGPRQKRLGLDGSEGMQQQGGAGGSGAPGPSGRGAAADRAREAESSSVLRGHCGSVYSVSLSPDGTTLLSGGADGTIRLYSTELKANVASYKAASVPVWDVAYAPLGGYFASGHGDRTARVFHAESPRAVRIFTGHTADVEVVAWHPNCHYLATGSSDRTVRLWDMRQGGACVRVLPGLRDPVTALTVSPNGRLLVGASEEGRMVVWDLAEAKAVGNLQGHTGPIWSLSFAHGGHNPLLASGGADCTVRLWDIKAASEHAVGSGGAPDPLVVTWVTRATPVTRLRWTHRNLLMATGAVTLRKKNLVHMWA